MIQTVFGADIPLAAQLFIALAIVVGVIGATAWVVRWFSGKRRGARTTRGRQPYLDVVEAAAVDGRRRLVLIRRENAEHLMMIGGPTDVVIEANIVRAATRRDVRAPAVAAHAPPPAEPLGEGPARPLQRAWPQPARPQPARPEPAPRPSEQAMRAEPSRRPQPRPIPSPPAQGQPSVDESLARLARILRWDKPARELPGHELSPLSTPRREK